MKQWTYHASWQDGALVTIEAEDEESAYEIAAALDIEQLQGKADAPVGVDISPNDEMRDIEFNLDTEDF